MAYRRPKSLWDLFVRAKLKPDMRDDEHLGRYDLAATQDAKPAKW